MSPPQWRVQIVKSIGAEQWSNDYLTDLTTLVLAESLASDLVALEEAIHMNNVHFDYMRISSVLKGDRIFRHEVLNVNGSVSLSDYLPLFNTLRVDFTTYSSDPARKYYRCPIAEGDQQYGQLSPSYLTIIRQALFTHLDDPGHYGDIVTTKGNKVEIGNPYDKVQMRQLHRHRRKKIPSLG